MDMQLLATDIETTLNALPPAFVQRVLGACIEDAPKLMETIPKLIPLLAPHLSAGVIEKTAGSLDMKELGAALMPVVQRYLMRTMGTTLDLRALNADGG